LLVLHSNCGWVRERTGTEKAKKPKKRVTKKQRKERKGGVRKIYG